MTQLSNSYTQVRHKRSVRKRKETRPSSSFKGNDARGEVGLPAEEQKKLVDLRGDYATNWGKRNAAIPT